MDLVSENRCFGGTQGVYRFASPVTGTGMTFGLFLPPEAAKGPVPVLWYLSGLTCTHENALTMAGAQAADLIAAPPVTIFVRGDQTFARQGRFAVASQNDCAEGRRRRDGAGRLTGHRCGGFGVSHESGRRHSTGSSL